jgi:hypothetical protein
MKYKIFFLAVLGFGIYACQFPKSDADKVTGKYFLKETGAILFEIKRDTGGYYALMANNGRKSPRDSFRLKESKNLESEWSGFCGETYDLWMSKHIIGGDDWRQNFNIGLYNSYNNFNFLSLKKGYTSKEHSFSTGYCMISGSECFITRIFRLNIDKVK